MQEAENARSLIAPAWTARRSGSWNRPDRAPRRCGDAGLARWRERLFDDLSGVDQKPELRIASAG